MSDPDPIDVKRTGEVDGSASTIADLTPSRAAGFASPTAVSIRILLERVRRNDDGETITADDVRPVESWPRTCLRRTQPAPS